MKKLPAITLSKKLSALTAALLILAAVCVNWRMHEAAAQEQEFPVTYRDPQVIALRRLQADSATAVRISFARGFPRSVAARVDTEGRNAVERSKFFLDQYRDLYAQNSPHLDLKVRRVNLSPLEGVQFYQTYRGLEVFGAELLVSLNRQKVFHTLGGLLTAGTILDTDPTISENQAELTIRRLIGTPDARLASPTKLMVFDRSLFDSTARSHPRLAWRVTLERGEAQQSFVDAHDGQILATLPSSHDNGQSLHGLDLDMQDAENEANAYEDNCYWSSDDVTVADEDSGSFNSNYNNMPDAVKGYADIKDVYRFFHQGFNRHSYDGSSSQLEFFIRSTTSSTASWVKECGLIQVESGKVSFDILGHEFMHGVISHTSLLMYMLEPGALNESYADIMAGVADQERHEALGQSVDWTLGEDQTDGSMAIRNIAYPELSAAPAGGQPDEMPVVPIALCPPSDLVLPPMKCNDYGGVHTNSGIPNKTAFLMVSGETHNGVDVIAMDRSKMRAVKYLAATHLLPNATFLDARNYEVAITEEFVNNPVYNSANFTFADVCSVRGAWAAVGVGAADANCDGLEEQLDTDDDDDLILDAQDNCPSVANPDQKNSDLDALGNACDSDDDNDGVPDVQDNCPLVRNPPDENGVQAPCDDLDVDGVIDTIDNCNEYNPSQQDSNFDNEGDACESDPDNDGVNADEFDNCPMLANPGQADADADGYGDACDKCPNTSDAVIAFKPDGTPFQPDSDDDGTPDTCDSSVTLDGSPAAPGMIKPDGRPRNVVVESRPGIIQRIPLGNLCTRNCPQWFADNDRVDLSLTGLDETTRVWIADEEGSSVKKATGPAYRRSISFTPLSGRSYYLSFAFRPRSDRIERDEFQMKLSLRGF